jgi:hypothetical protein
MIAVVVAGLFFALVARLGRLTQATNYHAEQMMKANASRPPSGPTPTPLETWHSNKMMEYRAEHERIDLIAFIILMACLSLGVVAGLGRVLHWLSRPVVSPPGPEPPRNDPGPSLSPRMGATS